MPWTRTLTLFIVASAIVVAVAAIVLLALSPTATDAGVLTAVLAVAAVSLTLALVLSARRPDHPLGPLTAFNGLALLVLLDGPVGAVTGRRPDLFAPGQLDELTAGRWMLLYLPLALLMLRFPDGRLPGPWWRPVGWGLPAVVVAFNAAIVMATQWPTTRGVATAVATPLPLVLFALLVAALASLGFRYRRSDRAVRQQLRWLVLPAAVIPATLLLCWVSYWLVSGPDFVVIGLLLIYLTVPAASTTALLWGDRADVDEFLVSATTYLMLGCGLVAIIATAMLVATRWSVPPALAITAAAALVVEPLRRRLQPGLGRWISPVRAQAVAALSDLTKRVHAGAGQPEEIQGVLRDALRDPGLQVWIHPVGSSEPLRPLDAPSVGADAFDPAIPDAMVSSGVAVTLAGARIGMLVPGPHAGPVPLNVARAAGFLIDFARLRAELTRALSEVQASRQRILRAGYEARRRLERDLHDGAQQRLVSLGLALRVLQRTQPLSPELTAALDAAVAEIGTAVAELRQIAHGLRPSALDDGLGSALTQLTRLCPTPIEISVDDRLAGATLLPDAVATTAYFVAAEAVTNAVRHAGAKRIRVTLRMEDDRLHLQVDDDGSGGAHTRPGSGLAGLHDRVVALGGRLILESTDRSGTTVQAFLPYDPRLEGAS